MEKIDDLLETYLCEQIALEEQLCREIEQQMSDIDDAHYPDARSLLIKTRQVLEQHFSPLNAMLDLFEKAAAAGLKAPGTLSLVSSHGNPQRHLNSRVSKLLRDDYSALNLIAMGNTMLHTTALAMNRQEVATIALEHLQHLAPLVIGLGELMPHVVAREAVDHSGTLDASLIGKAAFENIQRAWRSPKCGTGSTSDSSIRKTRLTSID